MTENQTLIETVTAADVVGLAPAAPGAPGAAPANETPPPPAQVSPAPAPAPGAAETDSLGRPFDPSKFKREKDSLKRWKNLFAGRGGKARAQEKTPEAKTPERAPTPASADVPDVAPEPEPAADPAQAAPGAPAVVVDRFTLLSDVYCRAGIAGAMGVFGDEWAPDDDSEYVALRDSVAAYLKATNQDDLSPGAALGFALLTYGAKRLPRPKTQSRISWARERLAAWWRGRRIARAVSAQPAP